MEVQKKKNLAEYSGPLSGGGGGGGGGVEGCLRTRRSSLLSHIHNHESRVVERLWRSLFIIRVWRIPADGRQVAPRSIAAGILMFSF